MRSTLLAWDRPDLIEDAELLVSELVTNVMRHTAALSASVGIVAHDDTIRVEVTDPSPSPLVRCAEPDLNEAGGLGLGIVDAIATRWGVVRAASGKTVWFELSQPSRVNAVA